MSDLEDRHVYFVAYELTHSGRTWRGWVENIQRSEWGIGTAAAVAASIADDEQLPRSPIITFFRHIGKISNDDFSEMLSQKEQNETGTRT